ncbi:hypothetical protein BDW74DRAFT_173848 [Aspergillus multicolor]|uniref:uncharacterized protein n=1 Tax=Aspergillus multicolor TaxID=41759 RepID=UPI003CCD0E32
MAYFYLTIVLSLLSLLHIPVFATPTLSNLPLRFDYDSISSGNTAGAKNSQSQLQARQDADQDPIILISDAVCGAFDEWDSSSVPEYVVGVVSSVQRAVGCLGVISEE